MGLDGVANGTKLYADGIEAASRLDRGRPRWASMGVASPQIHRSGPSSSPFGPESKFKNHSHLSESERCGLVLKLCWLFVVPRSVFDRPWSSVRPSLEGVRSKPIRGRFEPTSSSLVGASMPRPWPRHGKVEPRPSNGIGDFAQVGDVAQVNILATWRKWRTKVLEGRMLGNSGRPSRFWEAIEAIEALRTLL